MQSPQLGNHWGCLKINSPEEIKPALLSVLKNGRPVATGDEFTILAEPLSPFLSIAAVCDKNKTPLTTYPMMTEGQVVRLRLDEILQADPHYPEAELRCSFADTVDIVFWDTCYAINAAKYQVGEQYDFILSGIAYKVEQHNDTLPIIIDDPDRVRQMREMWGENTDDLSPITISMKGMSSFMPSVAGANGLKLPEYVVRGPVISHSRPVAGASFSLFEIAGLRGLPDTAQNVNFIVACHCDFVDTSDIGLGDDIFSLVWLQGRLAS